jgi:hypothetical protein
MLYRFAADVVVVVHLAFIVFVLLGGLLALRYRWVAWLHLPAATWGVFVELTGRLCPLTDWENELLRHAGEAGYAGGFVERYLLPIIYPAGLTQSIQFWLAGIVVAVNVTIYAWLLSRRPSPKGKSP